jgi:hypothetical protein
LERHYPTRTNVREQRANGRYRIALVHEDESSDEGIVGIVMVEGTEIAHAERDVSVSESANAFLSPCDGSSVAVDADNRSGGSDEFSAKQAHVTHPTSYVEYPHTRRDPRLHEKSPRGRGEKPRLGDQSLLFLLALPHYVDRVRFLVAHEVSSRISADGGQLALHFTPDHQHRHDCPAFINWNT